MRGPWLLRSAQDDSRLGYLPDGHPGIADDGPAGVPRELHPVSRPSVPDPGTC